MTDDAQSPANPKTLRTVCAELGVAPKISPGLDDVKQALVSSGDQRYDLAELLGRGGQGTVIHGVDQNLRRSVAVKVMARASESVSENVQAFIEEAIITGGLEHPNIVPAYDVGYTEELGFFYTMKRLRGRPLSKILEDVRLDNGDARSRFGQFRLLLHFADVCQAVAYAHSRWVVHADIKPANVLIGDYGETTVVDWGLAQIMGPVGQTQARAGKFAGTPEFMAPEQCSRTPLIDQQVDVWALGVLLFAILTNSAPFVGANPNATLFKVINDPVPKPSDRAPGVSIDPEIEAICMRALQKDRSARYPNVDELLTAIDEYIEGTRMRMFADERAKTALTEGTRLWSELRVLEDSVTSSYEPNTDDVQALFDGYSNVAAAFLEGYDADIRHRPLEDAMGDLYWRIFTRVYPAHFVVPRELQRAASALLTGLSRVCLSAIVRVGQKRIEAEGGAPLDELVTPDGDAWLATVLDFCNARPGSFTEAHAATMGALARHIDALRRVPLFAKLDGFDLLPIAEACNEVRLATGTACFAEGDPGDALYIVLEGLVDVVRDGVVLERFGAGEVFGEVGVLGLPRTAGVVAAQDTVCLALPGDELRRIIHADGAIGWHVMQVLAERMSRAADRESLWRARSTSKPPA